MFHSNPLFPPGTNSTSKRSWESLKLCSVKATLANLESKIFGTVCFSQSYESGPLIIRGNIKGLSAGKVMHDFYLKKNYLSTFLLLKITNQNCNTYLYLVR